MMRHSRAIRVAIREQGLRRARTVTGWTAAAGVALATVTGVAFVRTASASPVAPTGQDSGL